MPEANPPTATVRHLSAPGGFTSMSADAANLDKSVAGEPCHYYRKDLISEGEYVHPAKGFRVPAPADRIHHWAENGNRMLAAGVDVPINVDHSDRAEDARGNILKFEVGLNESGLTTLYGLCQIVGEDAALTAARNKVSVGINPNYVDGAKRDWGDSVFHVALTPVPVVPGQDSFQLLSQAERPGGRPDDDDLYLSAAGTPHKYASTQVQLPPGLAAAHQRFADAIPADDLAASDDGDGREVDPHVTCRYGLDTDEAGAVHAALHDGERKPAKVTLGKTAVFPATAERPSDVLHLSVESHDLHGLNGRLKSVDHVETQPTYTPHSTLAYLKPGRGAKYAGRDVPGLTGESFDAPDVRFSGRDGSATDLSLLSDDQTPVPAESKLSLADPDAAVDAAPAGSAPDATNVAVSPETAAAAPPTTTPPTEPMKSMSMSDATHDRLHELTPGLEKVAPGEKAACISQHMHGMKDQIAKLSMDDDPSDVAMMSAGTDEGAKAAERIAAARKEKAAAATAAAERATAAEADRDRAKQELSVAVNRADAAERTMRELKAEQAKATDPEVLESRAKLAKHELSLLVATGAITPAVRDALAKEYAGEAGKYNAQMLSRDAGTGHTRLDRLVSLLKDNVPVAGGERSGNQNLSLLSDPRKDAAGGAGQPDAGDIMAKAVRG